MDCHTTERWRHFHFQWAGGGQRSDGAYLGDFVDHFGHDGQAAHEDARGHEGARQLEAQLARHVAERLQLLRVPAHALHVGVAELVLHVDQAEHALQQVGPEVRQHGLQVDGGAARHVVLGEGLEEALEQLGVLHVHHAVGAHKHAVQRRLGVLQQLQEELWSGERQSGDREKVN